MARRAGDGKAQELAASRTLNPRPEAVVDEGFRGSEFFDARDLVQVKYEMVRRVEAERSSVSAAAGAFGFSRQSYYSAARALAEEGLAGLVPAKPGPENAPKSLWVSWPANGPLITMRPTSRPNDIWDLVAAGAPPPLPVRGGGRRNRGVEPRHHRVDRRVLSETRWRARHGL